MADGPPPGDLPAILAALAQRAGGDVELDCEEVETYRNRHAVRLLAGKEPGSIRVVVQRTGRTDLPPATTIS
ncbi:hypothetical protein [Saccharothrix xinjiangensis]|uniref:Uncharacterized protein n=1 Tax=Saccharothrix xinjiangensis TaxID=204798 RepID=A0ABV9XVZ0_9PSEU